MEQSLSVGTVDVQSISTGHTKPEPHPNDVQFEVKYPEDFKGKKHMPEGIVTVSKQSAEQFVKAGIGRIVEKTVSAKTEDDDADQTGDSKKSKAKAKNA